MTKTELVHKVSKEANLTLTEAQAAINAVFKNLKEALIAGDSYTVERFITLKPVIRAARRGYSPATGEKLDIPERRTVKAVPSLKFKAELNTK